MKELFLNIDSYDFVVHYEKPYSTLQQLTGIVYPIQKYSDKNNNSNWGFICDFDGSIIEELNKDCRKLFSFSFCWRGIWEGRIYFEDDEYWSEELSQMSKIWNQLERKFKGELKSCATSMDWKTY